MFHRVDLYISFSKGSQLSLDKPTHQFIDNFCAALETRICNTSSSIFYRSSSEDPNELDCKKTVQALMQLRGGGLALCFFTDEYFNDPICVAELHTLLHLHDADPDITLLFFAPSSRLLKEHSSATILFPELRFWSVSELPLNCSPDQGTDDLINTVCRVWNPRPTDLQRHRLYCLGQSRIESFTSLKSIFKSSDANHLATFFKINLKPNSTVSTVLNSALLRNIITYNDITPLKNYFGDSEGISIQLSAIREYERKWIRSAKIFCWDEPEYNYFYFNFTRAKKHCAYTLSLPVWSDTFIQTTTSADLFQAVFNVPKNPTHVVWDFTSTKTPESMLKSAILSNSSTAPACVTAIGVRGVGKTCALRAIGNLYEARRRFHGGILYMSVGRDAGLSRLILQIAEIVSAAGGHEIADQIRYNLGIKYAIKAAAMWFRYRPVLFLIDDIWALRGISSDVVESLSLLANNPLSRIALTTRDVQTCFGNTVQFQTLDPFGSQASKILSFSATQTPPPWEPSAFRVLTEILKVCNGLPSSLAFCRKNLCKSDFKAFDLQNEWKVSADSIQSSLWKTATTDVGLSLAAIHEEEHSLDLSVLARYFCIARRNCTISMRVIQKLWKDAVEHTEYALKWFERFKLVDLSSGTKWNSFNEGVVVTDDMIHFARNLAPQDETRRAVYRKLFGTLSPSTNISISERSRMHSIWRFQPKLNSFSVSSLPFIPSVNDLLERLQNFPFCTTDEEPSNSLFLFNNLSYFLEEAGMLDELIDVLTNPNWITLKLKLNGLSHLKLDIESAIVKFKQCTDMLLPSKLFQLRQFLYALQEACSSISHELRNTWNRKEFWFQLYGRLEWMETNTYVSKFLRRIEISSSQRGTKTTPAAFPPAGSALKHTIKANGRILTAATVRNLILIVFVDVGKIFSKCYNCDLATESGPLHLQCEGLAENISVARFSPDCDSLALGFHDGAVELFNGYMSKVLRILNLSMSNPSGMTTVAAEKLQSDAFRTMFFNDWPKTDGKSLRTLTSLNVGKFYLSRYKHFRKSLSNESDRSVDLYLASPVDLRMERTIENFNTIKFHNHTSSISTISVSVDGIVLVSGSEDGSLQISEKCEGSQYICQKLQNHKGPVTNVRLSWDGTRMTSSSIDCTVKAWELRNGYWICIAVLPQSSRVNCVHLSSDGCHIVSGVGNVIQIYRWTKSSKFVDPVIRTLSYPTEGSDSTSTDTAVNVHPGWKGVLTGEVRSALVSEGGNCVAAGLRSGEFIVWESVNENFKKNVMVNRDNSCELCSLGFDSRILSIHHEDSSVTLWQKDGGEWETDPYQKYLDRIRSK